MLPTDDIFERHLDDYFALFSPTLGVAEEFIAKRSYSQELLILLCARIDGLASEAAREDSGAKRAFVDFLRNFSRSKLLFESVSAPDLYYELGFFRWLLPGLIPVPGRIHHFSKLDYAFINLIEASGLALTEDAVSGLVSLLMRLLRAEFRVTAGQRLSKPTTVKVSALTDRVVSHLSVRRGYKDVPSSFGAAFADFARSKTLAAILYEKYRCESIHGAAVALDEPRFFSESKPYWGATSPPPEGGPFLLVEFPARFLLTTLQDCLRIYRRHLSAIRVVPPDVHFHMFGDDILGYSEFLDERGLPQGGPVRLRVPGR